MLYIPYDTETFTYHYDSGTTSLGTHLIYNIKDSTIFYINTEASSGYISVFCGSNIIYQNFNGQSKEAWLNYKCLNQELSYYISASAGTKNIIVNYIPYLLNKNDTTTSTTSNIASTTNGFTYGEVLTNFFLFLIILGLITGFILNKVIKK